MPSSSHDKISSPNLLEQAIDYNFLRVSAEASLYDVAQSIDRAQQQASVLSELSVKGAGSSGNFVLYVLVMAGSQLVGIVTQSDLLRLTIENLEIKEIKVTIAMTPPIVTLRLQEFEDVTTTINLLRQHHLSYLPLLDEHNHPLGIVTLERLLQIENLTMRSPQSDQIQQIEYQSLLTAIAKRIQASYDLQTILDTTVQEIRQFLGTDRVIAYQFEPDWSGIVVAESVICECDSLLGRVITDPHFGEAMVEPYKNGRIQVTDNIYLGLTECHTKFLERLQVQAVIVVPILQGEQLWGLLAAHECLNTRYWEKSSVSLLQQLAIHLSIAIQQADTMAQLQELNQELESKVIERTTALVNSKKRLNLIVSSVLDGILILDRDGCIVFTNPSAEKLFGMTTEQLVGLQVGVPNVLNNQFEISLLKNSGQIMESEMQVAEIEWDDRPAYLISLHDITERQQAKIQLQRTNEDLARATRLKDEFLANMSHELRTPLNAILGMTEGLQEEVFGAINDKQRKSLQTIERGGNHLLSLINDILDLAKVESGRIELDCTPTSIEYLCQSSLIFVKQLAFKKRIEIEVNLLPDLPEILIDERLMRQVLINLLSNAVKFTVEGGKITLEVSCIQIASELGVVNSLPRHYIQIAVIDTGIGISAENIKKLFQPFVQIDSALNRQYAGTGLGLALVKRIVELHGGQVGLTSDVGMGSRFSIELPDHRTVQSSSNPEKLSSSDLSIKSNSSQIQEHKSYSILLADDNKANISTFSSYLKAKGYRILVAQNGKEAIDLAKAHQPDLILMDIQMPIMDGLEAIKQIRLDPNFSNIPIIALTALVMTGDREKCLAAGANEYVTKPVKLNQLATSIQKFLIEAKKDNM